MNKAALITGIAFVTIALVFYTIATIKIQTKKQVSNNSFNIQVTGVIFDILGTIAMYLIRPGFSLTFHGIIGFIALFSMIIKAFIINKMKNRDTNKGLKVFSNLTYLYWLIVFILGMGL